MKYYTVKNGRYVPRWWGRLIAFGICHWYAKDWPFKICLGDTVWWKGDRYTVTNGTMGWRLTPYGKAYDPSVGHDGWVPKEECRKSWTPRNMWLSWRSGHRFYFGYWYSIWAFEWAGRRWDKEAQKAFKNG